MLYVESDKIKSLYVGEDEVTKAYLGGAVVYQNDYFVPRLPEGYTELKYIEATGAQCIDTGIKPDTTVRVEVDLMPTTNSTNNEFFIGSLYTVSATKYTYRRFQFFRQMSGTPRFDVGFGQSFVQTVSTDISNRRMNIYIDAGQMMAGIDNTSISLQNPVSLAYMPNIFIFANKSDTSTPSAFSSSRLYSFKIYNNNSLVRDCVPCINSLNIVGVYDLIGNKFYKSATTTNFIAGPKR